MCLAATIYRWESHSPDVACVAVVAFVAVDVVAEVEVDEVVVAVDVVVDDSAVASPKLVVRDVSSEAKIEKNIFCQLNISELIVVYFNS